MADPMKEQQDESQEPLDLPIPPHLKQKLEAFQQKLWSVKIAEGALVGLVGLGISYLLVFSLDRVIETPFWARALLLTLGFAVPAIGLPLRWHRWVRQQRTLEQIARLLRKRFPRLGDELLGIVELAHSNRSSGSRVLVEAAMRQVDEKIKNQDFDEAVPAPRYATWAASAIGVLALSGLLLVVVSDASRNALARWVSPWKPIDRYTFAQLEPVPDKVIVPFAEEFALSSELADSTEWKPEKATVKLPGKTKLKSDREEDRYAFSVPPQKEEGKLALRVGDEYKKIEVTPLPRPELVDLTAKLRLPDYLRYEEDPVIPVRGGTLSAVEGAQVTFTAKTSRELREARADGVALTVEGEAFSTAPVAVEEGTRFEVSWEDIHGLEAKNPLELRVTPVEDKAPDVFARQVTTERVVLVDEVVSFDLSAADDFGIKSMGLRWDGAPGSGPDGKRIMGEKPVASGAPEKREIETVATFSAAREGIEPQTLQIRAFAEDYLPDRDRSFSPTFVLHILSNEDHADWLTQEFGKWFRNAREVYEREQQLHETNRNLRSLSAEDLDKPENRRALEEQASAESANGRRLDALTNSGRDLVRQATKNDEFDAERLESWATMMRELDEIAKNRMPSVADLLKQASRESGKPSKPSDQPSDPKGSASSSPSSPQDSEEKPEKEPGKSGESGPMVSNQNGSKPDKPSGSKDGEAKDMPKVPSISDKESSMAENKEEEKGESPPSPPKPGRLTIPSTTLAAAGGDKEEEPQGDTPAQKKLDEAVKEQEQLLADFARIADQLQDILSSLEASTFVKRLKAASRKQTEIAKTLNEGITSGFGLPKHRIEQQLRDLSEKLASTQEEQSKFIYAIQTDLDAYYQRKQEPVFLNVLEQMKSTEVASDVKEIGEETLVNLSGRSMSSAEFWADTLDRWAEELVKASECKACEGDGSKESLPPEIVLEIMKVLQEQMYLRDETREMDSARQALAPDVYESKVEPLELTQSELRERVDEIVVSIGELPEAAKNFGKETQLLNLVSDVMRQARGVLARPDTGPEVIAAQTEAIELLLQSKRQSQGGGGGGGSSPGGGGSAQGGGAALTDINNSGTSSETPAGATTRDVDQSTGKAGRELPEEFRRGLDSYFNDFDSN